ncbi:MAG: DNA polymerase III subunit chi, partial [Sinobacterium sp.]|nr:DNA polymerase III subunit chi [Sinobacterium sp.]
PPIQIGYGECAASHHDIVINASTDKPPFFAMFNRLSEIVTQEPAVLNASRESYRYYQSRNYPLHRHDLR